MCYTYGPCSCPEPTTDLPELIQAEAKRGKITSIMAYLSEGGNLNGSFGGQGWTIMASACSMGHWLLLEKLLKFPDVHLNLKTFGDTPLTWALRGGHMRCVELLMRSNLQCTLDIRFAFGKLASRFYFKPKLWFETVNIYASYHDLEKIAELIQMKNRNFIVDIALTKAALERANDKVIELLKGKPDISTYLDGTLIAVSCMGTSEEVAKTLIWQCHEYHQESIETSLVLASMNNHLGILPVVIHRFFSKICYFALSHAQEEALKLKHKNALRLLEQVITVKCKNYVGTSNRNKSEMEKNYRLVTSFANLVVETPGVSESPLTPPTPPEAIEIGTPAMEEGKDVAAMLAGASSELATVAKERRMTTKGAFSSYAMTIDTLTKAADAQVRVAEALCAASKALALLSKGFSVVAPKSSVKGSQTRTSPDKEITASSESSVNAEGVSFVV